MSTLTSENNLVNKRPDGSSLPNLFGASRQRPNVATRGRSGDPVSGRFRSHGVFIAMRRQRSLPPKSHDAKRWTRNAAISIPCRFTASALDPSDPRSAYGLMQDAPGTLKYSGDLQWTYSQPPVDKGRPARSASIRQMRIVSITWIPTRKTDQRPHRSRPDSCTATKAGPSWTPNGPAITGLPTTADGNGNTITNYASFPARIPW